MAEKRRNVAAKRNLRVVEERWEDKPKLASIDLSLLLFVVFLLLFGLVMLYSASYPAADKKFQDSLFFIKKQAVSALIGVGCMLLASLIDYRHYKKLSLPILIVGLLGLIAVLIIGTRINGAKRWIILGPLNFQPSEIAKLSLIVFISAYIANAKEKMQTFVHGILIPFGILGVHAVLMLLEPHLSGTVIMVATTAVLIFVGGAKLTHTVLPAGIGVGALAIFISVSDYAKARFVVFNDPWVDPKDKGFQIIQSLYAIGSGGLFGLGLGNSRQKFSYIPEPYNDFIFAIVAEELGFVGAIVLIALFVGLIARGIQISLRVKDRFGSLLCMGIMCNVAVQVLLNIAVVSKVIPVTGISLPFFSYGGSSLIIILAEMGVVLNISRHVAAKS